VIRIRIRMSVYRMVQEPVSDTNVDESATTDTTKRMDRPDVRDPDAQSRWRDSLSDARCRRG
jgi:hypothetical protein